MQSESSLVRSSGTSEPLGQSGGFEGFGAVPVAVVAHDLAVRSVKGTWARGHLPAMAGYGNGETGK